MGRTTPAALVVVVLLIAGAGPVLALNEVTCPTEPATTECRGTKRRDHIIGTDGVDVISGRDRADTIEGAGGDDLISGGRGGDKIVDAGEAEDSDHITGGPGDDTIDVLETGNGSDDQDFVDCGPGKDTVYFNQGPVVDVIDNCERERSTRP